MARTVRQPSWKPTRKWVAAAITSLSGLAVQIVTAGHFGQSEEIATITVLAALAAAYFRTNEAVPS